MRAVVLAVLFGLVGVAASCGGDDDAATAQISSRETVEEYFSKLDAAWDGHLTRGRALPPNLDYRETMQGILASQETLLQEVSDVQPPPEAEEAQQRIVTAFTELIADIRGGLDEHDVSATLSPADTEAPESEWKSVVDEACRDLTVVAVTYGVESTFMCMSDTTEVEGAVSPPAG